MSRKNLGRHARVAIIVLLAPLSVPAEDASYVKEIENWRAERQAKLEKDDGWLTVAGLFWLREGENSVGAAPTNDFVLPQGSAPDVVGVFELKDRKARFRAAEGAEVSQNGERIGTANLEPGEKNAIEINNLSMWLHHSGERLAIRLRDLESPIRRDFRGLTWFAVDPAYRVRAKFIPYPEPKPVEMLNILGDIERYESPGIVEFELRGETVRMEPVKNSRGGLWLVFRDGTSGKESYPAARFLHTEPPENGEVVIDFNKAYNPPCTFNPYTTCPLPTEHNRLEIRIEAGEKDYKDGKSHS